MDKVTVAAVQATPVFLDREGTVEKAAALIEEAASQGAGIIAFPETFIPTYPDWVWRTTPWSDGGRLFERLLENSVTVPSAATDEIGRAAQAAKAYVVMGINEKDEHGTTIFNTAVYFSPDGTILGKHRKLMPTGGERLVWGMGDGSTMPVFDTPFGRLGGLICWENYMPLARFAMYAKGVDIWVAPTWDTGDSWVATLRHIAKEGRMHVIGVAPVLRGSDVPDDVPNREAIYGSSDDWLWNGYSAIAGPRGELLAGPLIKEEGILYAEVDSSRARAARVQFDPTGHYSRPDVFQLHVDEAPRPAAQFEGGAVASASPSEKRRANSADGAATRAKPQSPKKRSSTRSTK